MLFKSRFKVYLAQSLPPSPQTFWIRDWSFTLLPDGAAIWTAPTCHTYATYPGSKAFFPDWDTTTRPAPTQSQPRDAHYTAVAKMPIRKLTRAADHTSRINTERAHNNSDPPPPF
jgi:hypothetical protein